MAQVSSLASPLRASAIRVELIERQKHRHRVHTIASRPYHRRAIDRCYFDSMLLILVISFLYQAYSQGFDGLYGVFGSHGQPNVSFVFLPLAQLSITWSVILPFKHCLLIATP